MVDLTAVDLTVVEETITVEEAVTGVEAAATVVIVDSVMDVNDEPSGY